MLPIDHPARDIPDQEYFNNATQEFIKIPGRHVDAIHLQLEHSLMSIARWESKWHTSFLGREQMTPEEFLDYVRCMTVNPQKNPETYQNLERGDFERIMAYMNDPMSAIDLTAKKKKKSRKKTADTAESIYFAMIQLGIPVEWGEKLHFNRLSALIDYCAENDGGGGGSKGSMQNRPKSQQEMMEFYHALNQKNRKKYNSKG